MRLAIVEDNELLRGNLELLLGGEPEVELVGAFGDAESALPAITELAPDVALVDLGLPGRSGVELIGELCTALPELGVLAHTIFDDRDTVFAAIKAGASGYVLKGSTPRQIIEAVFELHDGGAPMTPKIARAIIREFQDAKVEEQFLLTARERQILKGLETGLTYVELAEILSISAHTVHSHVKRIYEKLHAADRATALTQARKKGII